MGLCLPLPSTRRSEFISALRSLEPTLGVCGAAVAGKDTKEALVSHAAQSQVAFVINNPQNNAVAQIARRHFKGKIQFNTKLLGISSLERLKLGAL